MEIITQRLRNLEACKALRALLSEHDSIAELEASHIRFTGRADPHTDRSCICGARKHEIHQHNVASRERLQQWLDVSSMRTCLLRIQASESTVRVPCSNCTVVFAQEEASTPDARERGAQNPRMDYRSLTRRVERCGLWVGAAKIRRLTGSTAKTQIWRWSAPLHPCLSSRVRTPPAESIRTLT